MCSFLCIDNITTYPISYSILLQRIMKPFFESSAVKTWILVIFQDISLLLTVKCQTVFSMKNPICTLTLSVEKKNESKKLQSVEAVKLFYFGILFMI